MPAIQITNFGYLVIKNISGVDITFTELSDYVLVAGATLNLIDADGDSRIQSDSYGTIKTMTTGNYYPIAKAITEGKVVIIRDTPPTISLVVL